jgi:hypothetical protein
MPQNLYFIVLWHFVAQLSPGSLHSHVSLPTLPTSQPFNLQAIFFDHVVIDNHCFSSLTPSKNKVEALVAVQVAADGKFWLGELEHIFLVNQVSIGIHQFGKI